METITYDQVKTTPGGTCPVFGSWRREFASRPQLARMVGWLELKAFVAKRGGRVEWEVRPAGVRFVIACGDHESWEAAMSSAEESAREVFREALTELGSP